MYPVGSNSEIALVTRDSARGKYLLPYTYENGTAAYLGDDGIGYPPKLYPNFTISEGNSDQTQIIYDNKALTANSTLLLGPLFLHNNVSLVSMTLAINSECFQSMNEHSCGRLTRVCMCMDTDLIHR